MAFVWFGSGKTVEKVLERFKVSGTLSIFPSSEYILFENNVVEYYSSPSTDTVLIILRYPHWQKHFS